MLSEQTLAERAGAILSADGIKVSARVLEMISKCEAGTLSFAEARAQLVADAKSRANVKSVKQD